MASSGTGPPPLPPPPPSSSNSEASPPAAKRSHTIEPSSIEPITWQQHYPKSKSSQIGVFHQWTIENFSYYCMSANSANEQYPSICSSLFSPSSNDKLKFRLQLFPNGKDENSEKHLSLYLKLESCDRNQIDLGFDFWIEQEGRNEKHYGTKKTFCPGNSWGTDKLCPLEDILSPSSKLAPGNVLTILCDVDYIDDAVEESAIEDLNELALTRLQSDCEELYANDELSDAVLVFDGDDPDEDNELRVHTAILAVQSKVFADMFEQEAKKKNNDKQPRFEITDVDAELGGSIGINLYSDYEHVSRKADKLLPFADKYQLHSFKAVCEGELCLQINPETVVKFLLLADMHQATMLKSKCIEYIHCHASCLLESKDMIGLLQSRPDLCYELFKQIPPGSCHDTWSPPTLTTGTLNWSYTCSSVSKCSTIWTITDVFWQGCPNHFCETSLLPSDKSNCDRPSVKQFSVKLYPYSKSTDGTQHLSLYLKLKCDEMMKVAVKVRASILVKDNSAKGYTQEICKRLSNDESIGWSEYITRERLNANANEEQMVNHHGKLVLLLEVFYIANIDSPVTKCGVNTLANEHKFSIARGLFQLYSSQQLTDIVFVLGNNKQFPAHKSIVSARSEVFAQMFARTNRVEITNVDDVEAFEQMLALVYGQTDGLAQWAQKMLPLLDKFKLNSLKQVCEIALCAQLDDTNVAQFLLLADKHKAKMLKSKAFEYIRSKYSVLTQNDSLKVIQQQNAQLFHELLCYKLDNWKSLSA